MRRHFTLAIAALFAGVALVALAAGGAGAATQPAPSPARLDIVKLSGLIDPLNADLLSRSLRNAEADHALALIVQLNSTGGTVSQARLDALTFRMGSRQRAGRGVGRGIGTSPGLRGGIRVVAGGGLFGGRPGVTGWSRVAPGAPPAARRPGPSHPER
ncbi:MAG: hypothetical protein NVS3B12_24240 [Acidimicrobiales bacterium]